MRSMHHVEAVREQSCGTCNPRGVGGTNKKSRTDHHLNSDKQTERQSYAGIIMTQENNENGRPKSLADLLARSQPEVSVKYIRHLNDESPDVAPVDTSSDRDQSSSQDPRSVASGEAESLQTWRPGEDVHARPTLTGGNPQSSKTMRPGPSDPSANPQSETSQG